MDLTLQYHTSVEHVSSEASLHLMFSQRQLQQEHRQIQGTGKMFPLGLRCCDILSSHCKSAVAFPPFIFLLFENQHGPFPLALQTPLLDIYSAIFSNGKLLLWQVSKLLNEKCCRKAMFSPTGLTPFPSTVHRGS